MPTSQARVDANRRNAQLSTGPRTDEGKAASRRNGLKHGLAGSGVVLTAEDATEVDLRNAELQAELSPKSRLGQILVEKLAVTSVRMERAARQEEVAIALRVRHAVEDFDQQRRDDAAALLDQLGEDPGAVVRRLTRSPEGLEALVDAWKGLRAALLGQSGKPVWTAWHRERAENLEGLRVEQAGGSRVGALSLAIWGEFSRLGETEGAGLDEEARQGWARARLVERIDAEVKALIEHAGTLDRETIELDRAEAPSRALFDPSKEASLARRYESEASRHFFLALKELRRVEAEAAERPAPAPAPTLAEPDHRAELGSSREEVERAPREPRPIPERARAVLDASGYEWVGRPEVANRAASPPAR